MAIVSQIVSRKIMNGIACIILCAAFNVQAADDDYLKMLEAEAEGSHIDDSGQANRHVASTSSVPAVLEEKVWIGECDYISDAMPSDLKSEVFASYIEQCSPGIYAFYHRLKSVERQSVYSTYTRLSPTNLTVLKNEVIKYF